MPFRIKILTSNIVESEEVYDELMEAVDELADVLDGLDEGEEIQITWEDKEAE